MKFDIIDKIKLEVINRRNRLLRKLKLRKLKKFIFYKLFITSVKIGTFIKDGNCSSDITFTIYDKRFNIVYSISFDEKFLLLEEKILEIDKQRNLSYEEKIELMKLLEDKREINKEENANDD